MMSIAAKKSYLLLSLLLLGSCQAMPTSQEEVREQRNMNMATTMAADPKMMDAGTANMTPATMTMLGGSMPLNQLALGTVSQMQMARYPNYPGMMSPFLGQPGLQTSFGNGYPTDPNMGLGLGLGLGQPTPGLGLGLGLSNNLGSGLGLGAGLGSGLGGYPSGAAGAGYMYGNPLYGNGQPMPGFGPQPALNNILPPGLAGAPTGLYGQPAAPLGLPMGPGYFGGAAEGMVMHY